MKPPYDYKRRLRETGRTQTSLAAHLNISKDSVGRLVNGTRKAEVDEHERAVAFIEGDLPEPTPLFQQIDVYGYAAAGGADSIALADDRILDRLEIPVGLTRGEAFGVRVAGDSMEPRLFSGEIVIVSRNVAPSRNGDCVVELRDGTALIKQYQGQRDGRVFLHQFNPDKTLELDGSRVRAIHAVVYRR